MDSSEVSGDEVDALFESEPERTKPVVVRRAKKKKRKRNEGKIFDVEVIKATVGVTPQGVDPPIRRVAAYCRVSTDQEAQSTSYELQCEYYTQHIAAKDNWILAGIYADEGLSGTQMKKRDQLLRLLDDCRGGKVDMILTKSISRLSRNVVDCLTIIRELKGLSPPVEVYFEKENLSSLDDKTDMVLSMMASIAQEESRSISANISWAIRKRMENGTQKIPTACLLGYASDEDGNLVIVEEEAEIVKYIYKSFIRGDHPNIIAERLNNKGKTTVLGNLWSGYSIRNILRNEKYCGDVLMQKTFTVDYITHKTKKNEGERDQYYIADHHDAIVTREVWNKAQKILDKMYYKNWKRGAQQRLIPLEKGLLKGFISICAKWKDISVTRLQQATEKVLGNEGGQLVELVDDDKYEESEDLAMSEVLSGFEVIDIEVGRSDSVMTVSGNMVKFNKATATELMHAEFVRMLIDAVNKQVAVQACSEKTRNAIPFSKGKGKQTYAITVKVPAIVIAVRKLLPDLGEDGSLTFRGKLFAEDKAIIYDLTTGKPVKRRGRRKAVEKPDEQETETEYMESEPLESEVDDYDPEEPGVDVSETDQSYEDVSEELEADAADSYEDADDDPEDDTEESGANYVSSVFDDDTDWLDERPAPRRRGRPPKSESASQVSGSTTPRRRGRPPKSETTTTHVGTPAPKRRGRPPKNRDLV